MNQEPRKNGSIKTALLSVTDKEKLSDLAVVLKNRDVRIFASSGTKKYLESSGVECEEISAYTDSPELLGGRVKTLHPKIHAGILADRGKPTHLDELEAAGIAPIDLVVVNLYPFVEKYRSGKLSEKELCEFIDIGGITLIRAAAKNFHGVTVLTDVSHYDSVIAEIQETGGTSLDTRRRLAHEAFARTCSYDAAISEFFRQSLPGGEAPVRMNISLEKVEDLRYGENPHQAATVYRSLADSPIASIEKHQGKALSYNNYLDFIAAFGLARDLGRGSVAIIKHTNPCGAAWLGKPVASFRRALATDRVSAFGGIVAVNGSIDEELARELNQLFLEVVLARSCDPAAFETLAKKKNLRVVTIPERFWDEEGSSMFSLQLEGVFLLQDADRGFPELNELKVVTKRMPSDAEMNACKMGWKVAKHVKSNAIVIADADGTVGIGAGQMSRVDSSQIATRKAFDAKFSLLGKVAASDAFFPFADGVTALATTGITAVIQPGGSIRDQEVIDAADSANISMLFTGRRHFRHV